MVVSTGHKPAQISGGILHHSLTKIFHFSNILCMSGVNAKASVEIRNLIGSHLPVFFFYLEVESQITLNPFFIMPQ